MYGSVSKKPSSDTQLLRDLARKLPSNQFSDRMDPSEYEDDWDVWLRRFFSKYLQDELTGEVYPFGEHHVEYWNWIWALKLGVEPRPFIGIWPRSGGKSTSAELASAVVGAFGTRKYVLYICDVMERAEDHVQNVAGMLESSAIERYYPNVGNRLLGKYGDVKGWRRNRLRCASGFTVDAVGLDISARGIKLDNVRPDLLIFDDIDGDTDNPGQIAKKIRLITTKFLPAGSRDVAVVFVQNMIHSESIAARLANVATIKADFLTNRLISGPFPAVHDLTYEQDDDGVYHVTGGTPIWQGMNLQKVEQLINRDGLTAFLTESQQEVEVAPGGMFDHLMYRHCRRDQVPELIKVETWVDPAVTDTDKSDSHGLQVDGLGIDNKIYRLFSWEHRSSPERSLTMALTKAFEFGGLTVGVETDQGGDTWRVVFESVLEKLTSKEGIEIDGVLYSLPKGTRLTFKSATAGSGHGPKAHRASQMLSDYESQRIVHVFGTHQLLERALRRFPVVKPFDLVDACYWSWNALRNKPRKIRSF